MSIKTYALFCVIIGVLGLAAIFLIQYHDKTCQRGRYDWSNPPKICQLGCPIGEVWYGKARMCVMSCPGSGCT
jgi:hypothetical protein